MPNQGSRIMDGEQVRRAVARVAHEIVERSGGAERLALIAHALGVPKRGVRPHEREM